MNLTPAIPSDALLSLALIRFVQLSSAEGRSIAQRGTRCANWIGEIKDPLSLKNLAVSVACAGAGNKWPASQIEGATSESRRQAQISSSPTLPMVRSSSFAADEDEDEEQPPVACRPLVRPAQQLARRRL